MGKTAREFNLSGVLPEDVRFGKLVRATHNQEVEIVPLEASNRFSLLLQHLVWIGLLDWIILLLRRSGYGICGPDDTGVLYISSQDVRHLKRAIYSHQREKVVRSWHLFVHVIRCKMMEENMGKTFIVVDVVAQGHGFLFVDLVSFSFTLVV